MAEDKMEKFAHSLGVELGEVFIILFSSGRRATAKIDNMGLWEKKQPKVNDWFVCNSDLFYLITGKCEIKKMPWKPQEYEHFFYPYLDHNEGEIYISRCSWIENKLYNTYYERGLVCKTEEQAENLAKLLIRTARKFQGFDDELEEKDYELEEKQE